MTETPLLIPEGHEAERTPRTAPRDAAVGTWRGGWPLAIPLILLLLVVVLPLATLVWVGANHGIFAAAVDPDFLASVRVTLIAATCAAALSLVLAAPAAYALVRLPLRRPVRSLVESAIASPVAVPHVIVGLAILLAFSPITPAGRLLSAIPVVETFFGVTLAFVVVSAPLATSVLKEAFEREGARTYLAARALGATPTEVFLRLTLRSNLGALIEASLVAWSRSLSEFGSVAIVAYFVESPPFFGGAPLGSVFVWAQFESNGVYAAASYASVLLLVALVPLVLLEVGRRWLRS